MNTLTAAATGVCVIAVTPFKVNGALDLVSTDRKFDFYLNGVSPSKASPIQICSPHY